MASQTTPSTSSTIKPGTSGPDKGGEDCNSVSLRGRLATAPDIRSFPSGASLARLLVTVRTTGNHPRTDVLPVTLWDPGKRVANAERGDRVTVEGTVQRRFWSDVDGRKSRVEVVANRVAVRKSPSSD